MRDGSPRSAAARPEGRTSPDAGSEPASFRTPPGRVGTSSPSLLTNDGNPRVSVDSRISAPSTGSGPAPQKLYSSPKVHSTFGRRPPRLSGHTVLPTSMIPEPVTNLKPNEPLIWSSRSFGMLVGSTVRRKGAS